MTILNVVRKMNKFVGCNQEGRISIENRFKSKAIYNYLDIPERSFKSNCTAIEVY